MFRGGFLFNIVFFLGAPVVAMGAVIYVLNMVKSGNTDISTWDIPFIQKELNTAFVEGKKAIIDLVDSIKQMQK